MNGNIQGRKCQEGREGKELLFALTLTMIPTMQPSCPVSDGLLSFTSEARLATLACVRSVSQKSIACGSYFWDRSGKVTKEAPQGTHGPLTSFILQELPIKTGLNVALS